MNQDFTAGFLCTKLILDAYQRYVGNGKILIPVYPG